MFGNFEEDARKVLALAKKEMYELKHPYVSSEHLLLGILKGKNEISERLKGYNLDYKIFKKEVIKILGVGSKNTDWFLYTPLLKRIIENAIMDARDNNDGSVTINHLFTSLLDEGEGVAIRILIGMDIDIDELYSDFIYKLTSKKGKQLLVEQIGVNLNEKAINGEIDPVFGREKEIKRILEILSRRSKNNPVLIGDAGVGKTAIVEELARMIVNGDVPISLRNKRIISLDMASAVSGTKYRGEFEERVNTILNEVSDDDDIILFIDEVHTLVGAGGAEGAIDASNIFKPALARGKIRCIGATTTSEYKRFIEKDSALERRFQKVLIEEADNKMVKNILYNLKEIYEGYHGVIIGEDIIDYIIKLSDRYIYNRNEPDRSLDILDEVCAMVSLKEGKYLKEYRNKSKELNKIISNKKKAIINNNFEKASRLKNKEYEIMDRINNLELLLYKKNKRKVTKSDVEKVVSLKSGVPFNGRIENNLFKDIIGQDEAVSEVLKVYKKIKLGFNDRCYSFMFVGPSGVGKTMLALEFGKSLSDSVIKLDMSEYRESNSINKIIGSPPGYTGYDDDNILDKIKNKPFSVIILDELEKAHSSVINLFLQVLDEGRVKNSKGDEIRFDNAIIIMTSNVGYLDKNVGFNKCDCKLDDSFSIPFMNRVDKIIYFNNLDSNSINIIVKNKLDEVTNKYKDKIDVKYGDGIFSLIDLSDCDKYGARKIGKIIKDKVENIIIDAIIDNKDSIYIDDVFCH